MTEASPSGSHSRRVLKGFAAMSGTSVGVMVVQLGYAAVTSRVMGPDAFGAYAVALSGVGILGMVGGSSLGQAAARRDSDSESGDGALLTVALLAGLMAATLACALAPLWGQIWGVPDSAEVTRVMAVSMPLVAASGVLAGVLRRFGRTHVVAVRSAVGQLLGMAVGLAAVVAVREPWSLAVTGVAAALFTCALLAITTPRGRRRPRWPDSHAVADVVYGAKAAGMNLLRTSSIQLSRWSIARYAGASSLGAYNRATTLVTIPLQTLQTSFSFALFPELRPGGPVFSKPRAFTDILILVSWPTLIVATIGFFAAPPFVAILLGPDWGVAADLAGLAALTGVVPMLAVPLGSAVEALGWFRVTMIAWALGLCAVTMGILATARTGQPQPAMLGLLGVDLVLIVVAGFALARRGLIQVRRFASATWPLAGLQGGIAVALFLTSRASTSPLTDLLLIAVVGLAEGAVLWVIRARTPFGQIAKTRGLPGFGARGQGMQPS